MGGPLRIRLSDMKAWIDLRGVVRQDDLNFFLRMVPELDGIWIADHYDQQENRKRNKAQQDKVRRPKK